MHRPLTPTEQAIADLAARGRTNDEIARVLYLSVKTVEWNLTKIYRALGLRSRTELAASWTAGSGDSPGKQLRPSRPGRPFHEHRQGG